MIKIFSRFMSISVIFVNNNMENVCYLYPNNCLEFWFLLQKMNTVTSENAKNANDSTPEEMGDRVRLKKQLGLLEGVAIILGIIFGSGQYDIYNKYASRLNGIISAPFVESSTQRFSCVYV